MILKNIGNLFDIFSKHQFAYAVIGGHAMVHYGRVRTTEDLDIVWLNTLESRKTLASILESIHAVWISDEMDPKTGIEKAYPVTLSKIELSHMLILDSDFGFIDFFDYVPGCPQADVSQFMAEAVVAGNGIRYASKEWMIRMKQASGRPVDLEDLRYLSSKDID